MLEGLPGLGPLKAQAIIEYRRDHGAFATLDDLDKVPGIGLGIFEQIKPYLMISPDN